MSKRGAITTVRCHHQGCKELGVFRYDSRREMNASRARDTWTCIRHSSPDEVLSTDRTKTVVEYVTDGKYWNETFGFIGGHGYKAWAEEFPPGTKLVLTAEIVLPDA